jgi:hypothetical protein
MPGFHQPVTVLAWIFFGLFSTFFQLFFALLGTICGAYRMSMPHLFDSALLRPISTHFAPLVANPFLGGIRNARKLFLGGMTDDGWATHSWEGIRNARKLFLGGMTDDGWATHSWEE